MTDYVYKRSYRIIYDCDADEIHLIWFRVEGLDFPEERYIDRIFFFDSTGHTFIYLDDQIYTDEDFGIEKGGGWNE